MHPAIAGAHFDFLWLLPTDAIRAWAATCSSAAAQLASHPSWQLRALQLFGGDFGELHLATPQAWRELCAELGSTSSCLAQLGQLPREERQARLSAAGRDFRATFDRHAPFELHLRWTLLLPSPAGGAEAVVYYYGSECRLHRFKDSTDLCLWSAPNSSSGSAPPALRAVVATDSFYLLADSDRIREYDLAGALKGSLCAPQVRKDFLEDASDLFLSDDGQALVLEMADRLVAWYVASGAFLCEIPSFCAGGRLQSRPAGRGTIAIWMEEGGHELQIWALSSRPRMVARWLLCDHRPGRSVVHVGVFPVQGLVGVLDAEHEFHIVALPWYDGAAAAQGAWEACPAQESGTSLPEYDVQPAACEVVASHPLFGDPPGRELEPPQAPLPCSMSLRSGLLSFVEAQDLETHVRKLHVWDLLDEQARLRRKPLRRSFAFQSHGTATVSVPRPALRRFVLLKSCSVRAPGEAFVTVSLVDLRAAVGSQTSDANDPTWQPAGTERRSSRCAENQRG